MRRFLILAMLAACGKMSALVDAMSHGGDDTDAPSPTGDAPASSLAGWLFTQGNEIHVHGASGDSRWMGRGVNLDDIFLCGYNNTLYLPTPDATLGMIAGKLVTDWKPTFVRVSLGMASYTTHVSWTANAAQYQTPMTSVIEAIGANPGVYVLVSLRSEDTMIDQDMVDGDPEATGIPSAATDATYTALVDTFAHDRFVLFGITNEPGGNKQTNATIAAAMTHAVAAIRAEEDHLGVPHHLISVQGNGWTSDLSYYATAPIAGDDIVYEIHGYPPTAASYTYANLPVIIGEYGSLPDASAFYADVEAKQVPNLAWDFEPYSDCTPDLLTVNQSATNLVPSAWGTTVKSYLLAH